MDTQKPPNAPNDAELLPSAEWQRRAKHLEYRLDFIKSGVCVLEDMIKEFDNILPQKIATVMIILIIASGRIDERPEMLKDATLDIRKELDFFKESFAAYKSRREA